MSTADKRRAKRSQHDSVLELFDEAGDLITGVGRLINFSAVGACFSTAQAFKIGDKLQGRIRLLKEGVWEVKASVVWSRRKPNTRLYGIEFQSVIKLPKK